MTVVVDTNLWVSALVGKRVAGLIPLVHRTGIEVITGEEQLAELHDVLSRPKIVDLISAEQRTEGANEFQELATLVKSSEPITVCRDPKDNHLLEIAVAGKADAIVTGDKDLLVLHPFRGIAIISYADFERRLGEL